MLDQNTIILIGLIIFLIVDRIMDGLKELRKSDEKAYK